MIDSRENQVDSTIVSFDNLVDSREHVALLITSWNLTSNPLVRIHSECLTGDVFGSARCDCGRQLQQAVHDMTETGGIILYLRQEGRNIGLYNKLDAYAWQDRGLDTYEANEALQLARDGRNYMVAAQMLLALGVSRCELLTNNPEKAKGLIAGGVEVPAVRATEVFVTEANRHYLETKRTVAGHTLDLGAVLTRTEDDEL